MRTNLKLRLAREKDFPLRPHFDHFSRPPLHTSDNSPSVIQQLLQVLTASKNDAADDVLLEALRLGTPHEQSVVLDALIQRQSARGLGGVIAMYDALTDDLKLKTLDNIRAFYHA